MPGGHCTIVTVHMYLIGSRMGLVCKMFIMRSSIHIPPPCFRCWLLQWPSSNNVSLLSVLLTQCTLSTLCMTATQVVDKLRTMPQFCIIGMLRLWCTYWSWLLTWSLYINRINITCWYSFYQNLQKSHYILCSRVLMLFNGREITEIASFCEKSQFPSNTQLLGPPWIHITNGISIGSSVFAQLTVVTNRSTHKQTMEHRDRCNNKPYLCYECKPA